MRLVEAPSAQILYYGTVANLLIIDTLPFSSILKHAELLV